MIASPKDLETENLSIIIKSLTINSAKLPINYIRQIPMIKLKNIIDDDYNILTDIRFWGYINVQINKNPSTYWVLMERDNRLFLMDKFNRNVPVKPVAVISECNTIIETFAKMKARLDNLTIAQIIDYYADDIPNLVTDLTEKLELPSDPSYKITEEDAEKLLSYSSAYINTTLPRLERYSLLLENMKNTVEFIESLEQLYVK